MWLENGSSCCQVCLLHHLTTLCIFTFISSDICKLCVYSDMCVSLITLKRQFKQLVSNFHASWISWLSLKYCDGLQLTFISCGLYVCYGLAVVLLGSLGAASMCHLILIPNWRGSHWLGHVFHIVWDRKRKFWISPLNCMESFRINSIISIYFSLTKAHHMATVS